LPSPGVFVPCSLGRAGYRVLMRRAVLVLRELALAAFAWRCAREALTSCAPRCRDLNAIQAPLDAPSRRLATPLAIVAPVSKLWARR
jgi:hypothetical protein